MHRAEPDELYNLAATSFVPASWRQPVMTAQFTAVGVTSCSRRSGSPTRSCASTRPRRRRSSARRPSRRRTRRRRFARTTPTRVAKLYGHLMVATYRERYGMHASAGSSTTTSRRGGRRSSSRARSPAPRRRSSSGWPTSCALGDLDATRDWSYAGDVVDAMWLMLQQDEGDDYVVCSGVSRGPCASSSRRRSRRRTIDDSTATSSSTRSSSARPIPSPLVGDPSKAREKLGWERADLVRGHDRR